jgi:hypothetical protein
LTNAVRADAARNFDAILIAARAEFTEHGTDAALNLTIDDVLRYIVGVTGAPFGSNAQRELLDEPSAGLAVPASPQPPTNACGVPREALRRCPHPT